MYYTIKHNIHTIILIFNKYFRILRSYEFLYSLNFKKPAFIILFL